MPQNEVVGGQVSLIGSINPAMIWDKVSDLLSRVSDLRSELTPAVCQQAVLALAIFVCFVGVVRCIRTAFSRF